MEVSKGNILLIKADPLKALDFSQGKPFSFNLDWRSLAVKSIPKPYESMYLCANLAYIFFPTLQILKTNSNS